MIDIYGYTSKGGRESNEDFIGYTRTPNGVITALADGLGGFHGGDTASRSVVDTVIDVPYDTNDDAAWLSTRLRAANFRVIQEQHKLNNHMRSTVVALRISDDRATWAHAGDSRLYYLHDGMIADVTADHSVAFKKYLAGEIRRTEIASDEDQSTLLNSVGSDDDIKLEFGSAKPCKGDGFVICSDGVWENLLDQEIAFDLLKADSAEQWAELLLLRVIQRMGRRGDNLSLITLIIK